MWITGNELNLHSFFSYTWFLHGETKMIAHVILCKMRAIGYKSSNHVVLFYTPLNVVFYRLCNFMDKTSWMSANRQIIEIVIITFQSIWKISWRLWEYFRQIACFSRWQILQINTSQFSGGFYCLCVWTEWIVLLNSSELSLLVKNILLSSIHMLLVHLLISCTTLVLRIISKQYKTQWL